MKTHEFLEYQLNKILQDYTYPVILSLFSFMLILPVANRIGELEIVDNSRYYSFSIFIFDVSQILSITFALLLLGAYSSFHDHQVFKNSTVRLLYSSELFQVRRDVFEISKDSFAMIKSFGIIKFLVSYFKSKSPYNKNMRRENAIKSFMILLSFMASISLYCTVLKPERLEKVSNIITEFFGFKNFNINNVYSDSVFLFSGISYTLFMLASACLFYLVSTFNAIIGIMLSIFQFVLGFFVNYKKIIFNFNLNMNSSENFINYESPDPIISLFSILIPIIIFFQFQIVDHLDKLKFFTDPQS